MVQGVKTGLLRRELSGWLLLIAALLYLTGCDSESGDRQTAETTAPDRQPTVYRHALDGAPTSLDPAQAGNQYASFIVVNLYDTLYRYEYLSRPYQLTPNLAAAMPQVSDDGLSYTIPLKRGVRFADDPAFTDGEGREVVAADVVYSIKRHFNSETRSQGAWLWDGWIEGLEAWKSAGADPDQELTGLRAIDSHTLLVTLSRPYPQFMHTLAQAFSAVVPREAVEAYGAGLASQPVGSGPFRLQQFDSAGAVLAANPDFREEPLNLDAEGFDPAEHGHLGIAKLAGRSPPLVDRVELQFIAENAARWNALRSRQGVDYARVPSTQFGQVLAARNPPQLLPDLAEDFHLKVAVENGFVHTDFNMNDPTVGYHSDPERSDRNRYLRCAISRAFDWPARNQQFYQGLARVYPGIVPPMMPEFDGALPDMAMQADVDEARKLLEQGGWTADNLPVLEYGFDNNVDNRQMFEQFRGFLTAIGYPAGKIQPRVFATFGDYARAFSQGQVMIMFTSWTLDYPDVQNTLQLFYGPNSAPGPNQSNFDHPEFNRLYEEVAVMQPSAKRTEKVARMNQIVMDECVTLSGLSRTLVFLWRKDALMQPDHSFLGGHFLRFVGRSGAASE